MSIPKKVLTKSQLLDWLNTILKPAGLSCQKVQSLGTGVVYLNLLNHLHPGTLTGVKYNKKPVNQYEYLHNLKLLATSFMKLGVQKNIEVEKLAKLKLQDNLAFLQWFYSYSLQAKNRNQSLLNPQLTNKDKELDKQKNNKLKIKLKAPEKITVLPAQKYSKQQLQQNKNELDEIVKINSAQRKITQIESIISCQQISTDQQKLTKIMQILNLKQKQKQNKDKQIMMRTPTNTHIISENINQFEDQNVCRQNIVVSKKEPTYVKCRKLEQKYQQYMKANMIKKPQEILLNFSNQSRPNSRRRSVVLNSHNNQVFQYNKNDGDSIRLTDNQNLLHSDRKSATSQTNLLPDM